MFEALRRVLSAALLGGFLAVAPSEMWYDVTRLPPAIVLGVGEPTPSIAIRPHR